MQNRSAIKIYAKNGHFAPELFTVTTLFYVHRSDFLCVSRFNRNNRIFLCMQHKRNLNGFRVLIVKQGFALMVPRFRGRLQCDL